MGFLWAPVASFLRAKATDDEKAASAPPCFIDEELDSLSPLGLHAFFLVRAIQQRAAYPQAFVDVVRELSHEYCEVWARSHLSRKIEPLRERIRMEQYESSNEVSGPWMLALFLCALNRFVRASERTHTSSAAVIGSRRNGSRRTTVGCSS